MLKLMVKESEQATSRVSVTPTAHEELKDFKNGLGADFSEAILFLLEQVKHPNESSISAGKRLRDNFKHQQSA